MVPRFLNIVAICFTFLLRSSSASVADYNQSSTDRPFCPQSTATEFSGVTTITDTVSDTTTTTLTVYDSTTGGPETQYVARAPLDYYAAYNSTTPSPSSYQVTTSTSDSNSTDGASCVPFAGPTTTTVASIVSTRATFLITATAITTIVRGGGNPSSVLTTPSLETSETEIRPSPTLKNSGGGEALRPAGSTSPPANDGASSQSLPPTSDNSGPGQNSGPQQAAAAAALPLVSNSPDVSPGSSQGSGGLRVAGAAALPPGSSVQGGSQPDATPIGIESGGTQAGSELPSGIAQLGAGDVLPSGAVPGTSNEPPSSTPDDSIDTGVSPDDTAPASGQPTEFSSAAHRSATKHLLAALAGMIVLQL